MMQPLLLAAAFAFPGGVIGLLFKIAIFCVVIWAIVALITWLGSRANPPWKIPEPLRIIGIAVICIVIIYWLYQLVVLAM
jgi:hypothetical protein